MTNDKIKKLIPTYGDFILNYEEYEEIEPLFHFEVDAIKFSLLRAQAAGTDVFIGTEEDNEKQQMDKGAMQ